MKKQEPRLKLSAALLCDEIRKEIGNKEILLGVYAGSILVQKLPVTLGLSLWILAQTSGKGELKLEFRAFGPDKDELFHVNGTSHFIESDEPSSFPLPRIPIEIEEEGWLEFQWKVGKARWKTVLKKRVRLGSPSPDRTQITAA